MSSNNSETPQPSPGGNPHDYFGRKTIGDPIIAADFLRYYADDPVIAKYIDLDHLQAEPTQFFGPTHPITGPKEVILDVPYIAHLHDPDWKSEVLIVYEHKSSPSLYARLQLAVQAILSLYKRWTDAGRPTSRQKFQLPFPLTVLVYCGEEDLEEGSFWFQDIFGDDIPEPLRQFVPQYRLIVVNMKRFDYGNLPGRPETQSVAETMKRAFDGTLEEHFPNVLGRFSTIPIDDRITEIIGSIAWYSDRVTDIEPERIIQTITNVIKGKEGIDMAEVLQKGVFRRAFENGFIEGETRGKAIGEAKGQAIGQAIGEARGQAIGEARGQAIGEVLVVLRARFKEVPPVTESIIRSMTDITALKSLAVHAETCQSLEEFEKALN